MNRDAALMNEIWAVVKPHLPAKERLHVADGFVEIFDEWGMTEGLEHETDIDKDLRVALTSLYGLNTEEEEDDFN